MKGPNFLADKYPDLPGSKRVERAVRKNFSKDKPMAKTKDERISAYLTRLEKLIQNPRSFHSVKHKILAEYSADPKGKIPETYAKLQERILRERGRAGDSEEEKEKFKRENFEAVAADQRSSLEQWVDYLGRSDSNYIPPYLKYWIFKNILRLSEYDREKKEFPKRSEDTLKQFPDINHKALSYVVEAVVKKHGGGQIEFGADIQPEQRSAFSTFLAKDDFARLYAWANELINPIPEHLLPVTDGAWKKYNKDSDPMPLVDTIRGRGTGWCTAGENTAKTQLAEGDFYVFYSNDDEEKPTIPRIAIRMKDGSIEEVRGVAYKQNLDPYMGEVLGKKLAEFPDGSRYLKRNADMRFLTDIERKVQKGDFLTVEELAFLYEMKGPIEGFGQQKDPRVEELRKSRDVNADILLLFECTSDQIAHNNKEITENTKVYVGPLFPGIFKLLENIEHTYTSFPEGRVINMEPLLIGDTEPDSAQRKKNLMAEVNAARAKGDFEAYEDILSMIESEECRVQNTSETLALVHLSVLSMGFPNGATIKEIFARAKELGLALVPAETGPRLRLAYKNQPDGEYLSMGMEPITGPDGNPTLFDVARVDMPDWFSLLNRSWAKPDQKWRPEICFVFRKLS